MGVPRVFLSSTFTDLSDYRTSVQAAIRQFGAIDVSMEHFGARDQRPAAECIRLIKEESDLFVGIYAHRYGFIPKGSDISICEMEYLAASEISLPRFIYTIDEDQPWLPANIDDGMQREKLKAFKEALSQRHICQSFKNKDGLAAQVVADVGRHITTQQLKKVGPGIPVNDAGLESLINNIGFESAQSPVAETEDDWNIRRRKTYERNRGVFLTHIIYPSKRPEQDFDVYIYLIRHKSESLDDIQLAEFFLGPYWENRTFPAIQQNGFIGISTSAYGTFLCVCRVTFKDGQQIYLDRYIDFEMRRTAGV